MDKLVYLIYPILIFLVLFGAKFFKKGTYDEGFMSLEQTKYMQGFFAFCIMLHHIGQETCASWQTYKLYPGLEIFVPFGYFFVAVFMLCSGYGLYKSTKTKENYLGSLSSFFKKRILPIVIAFYASEWLFFVGRLIMGERMNMKTIIYYILGLKLANLYAWFAVVMPFFYLLFYFAFRFIKKENIQMIVVVIGVFLYTLLGTNIDHNDYWFCGEWWYNCVHMFWVGILFAKFEKKIVAKIQKKYILYFVLTLIFTLVFYVLSEICKGVFSYYGQYNPWLSRFAVVRNRWICLTAEALASANFVFFVLILNMKLKIGNKFWKLMGNITLEFYLIHGFFLELFSFKFCEKLKSITRITNVFLLIIIVFALSLPTAYGLHILISKTKKIGKNKKG